MNSLTYLYHFQKRSLSYFLLIPLRSAVIYEHSWLDMVRYISQDISLLYTYAWTQSLFESGKIEKRKDWIPSRREEVIIFFHLKNT